MRVGGEDGAVDVVPAYQFVVEVVGVGPEEGRKGGSTVDCGVDGRDSPECRDSGGCCILDEGSAYDVVDTAVGLKKS